MYVCVPLACLFFGLIDTATVIRVYIKVCNRTQCVLGNMFASGRRSWQGGQSPWLAYPVSYSVSKFAAPSFTLSLSEALAYGPC